MLDIQLLRTDLGGTAQRLSARGYALEIATFEAFDHRESASEHDNGEI